MNEKIEFIRQKCIEANPEIKKLEFGCKFKSGNRENVHTIYHVSQNHPFWFEAKTDGTDRHLEFEKKDVEIIGRPIRLADVLLAIGGEPSDEGLLINTGGDMCVMKIVDGYGVRKDESLIYNWNLKDDNLENQSEETIDFIYNLLT